jgi:hypothetical protein
MNHKTDPPVPVSAGEQKSEFMPGFVRWMVTLTVLTLAFVFLSNFVFVRFNIPEFSPLPWVAAGGLVVNQGLTLFSGGSPEVPSMAIRVGILIGLLLAFVVGPAVFFFSWRKLLIGEKSRIVRPANIGFILGGVVLLFYVLTAGVGAIVQHKVFRSMQAAQALGENRDGIIGDMRLLSLDAYQYKILPKSLGGGNGSYSGYDIPERLQKSEFGTYQIVAVSDSVITFFGASRQCEGASVQGSYGPESAMKGPFDFHGEFR